MIVLPFVAVIIAACTSFFTISFGLKKIGHKIHAIFHVVSEKSYETRITNVILQNHKDKPVCVYRLLAVFEKKYTLELKKFNEPVIIKPFEALTIHTDPYSKLILNDEPYVPEFNSSEIEIYIELFDRVVLCNTDSYKRTTLGEMQILKKTKKFNGIVYNDGVKYFLCYMHEGQSKTAFIHKSGHISEDWSLSYNFIKPKNNEITEIEIKEFLEKQYINNKIIAEYKLILNNL
ncbi:hypothetical protein ACNPQK_18700 [Acinetobacter guillouiae]|uniref:hypothetical protein n=1 Tax=Acinetobacter guillouiae TaxID=106649 RepID=UPI003AF95131